MNNAIPFKPVLKKWLQNPEFNQAYQEQQPEFAMIRAILDARIKKGLTQNQLAQRIGTKQAVISRLESGAANPSVSFLKRLATALDATLEINFKFRQ